VHIKRYNIHVSQGSVAMHLRCGGNFNHGFIADCPQSVPVKELLKLDNIWRKYGQTFGGTFYGSQCTVSHIP